MMRYTIELVFKEDCPDLKYRMAVKVKEERLNCEAYIYYIEPTNFSVLQLSDLNFIVEEIKSETHKIFLKWFKQLYSEEQNNE